MEQPLGGGATRAKKAYEIRVAEDAGFYKFRVSIIVQVDSEALLDMTASTLDADDGYNGLQAELCRDLLQTFIVRARADADEVAFAYDGRKAFYANRPLPDALAKVRARGA
ncbi:hypothetical protein AAVH_26545 [Aphelenchoides avenae]|nr:hypothetical protein AAVH_26545 [Aphelenchus avenae]